MPIGNSPSGGGAPSGAAGGDLTGTYPSPTVAASKITAAKLASGAAAAGTLATADGSGGVSYAANAGSVGVWKVYGTDSTGAPLSGVTVGNGTLSGKWWTPAAVSALVATDPFLAYLQVIFVLGSTSAVSAPTLVLPALVDGSANDMVFADNSLILLVCGALIGGTKSAGFSSGTGAIVTSAGVSWAATVPGVWADASVLTIAGCARCKFIAD